MQFNTTCNSTLEDLMITSEKPIVGNLTFHQLGLIIAGACSCVAITLSLYLMWMHALHYTKPYEQRHIIRILFMVPIYATASFLSFWFYWHAIYYQVISDCYEAFTIASFFALLCHYIAPDLHSQKDYFRGIQPRGWVWPLSWMRKCCCGDRGPWRTPRSGLTWFNIIWLGIYQYCFIRVAMTITAVLTQYFSRYCESSNSPVFAHIWVLAIECVAVAIAMYCVIQFYIQLRVDLAPHKPLLKVTAIKLVIFLSFWQTFLISVLTSTFDIVHASATLAYPDIKVGIPALLLCVEMAVFAIIHIFAYPWKPYATGSVVTQYPISANDRSNPGPNSVGHKQGGPLGIAAIWDAMNIWDLVKAFGRAMRWMFVGMRHRETDISYKLDSNTLSPRDTGIDADTVYKGTSHLPIAEQFRRSKFGLPTDPEEGAGLISNAQANPYRGKPGQNSPTQKGRPSGQYTPARERYDPQTGQEISTGGRVYDSNNLNHMYSEEDPRHQQIGVASTIGMATSGPETEPVDWSRPQEIPGQVRAQRPQVVRPVGSPHSVSAHQMLWGPGQNGQSPDPNSPGGAVRPGRDLRGQQAHYNDI